MDLRFSARDEQFRMELRAFIQQELPPWWRGMFVDDERIIPFTLQFCQRLADRGWLVPRWPKEFGGGDGTIWQEVILREEMWAHDEPRGPQYLNLNFIGPMIIRFGTEEQKHRFLPPMAKGTALWTQGFSEPDSGTDLASIRTTAIREGNSYRINGQKIWNSYADAPAQWCLLVARTDPERERRAGISVLLVDMSIPGISVRPIRSMGGPRDINEIFFDDVITPSDCLLGGENEGWQVITAGLTFERLGIARYARTARLVRQLSEYLRSDEAQEIDDDVRAGISQQLSTLYVQQEAARWLTYEALASFERGDVPSVDTAIARVHCTLVEQEAGRVGLETLGCLGRLRQGDPLAPLDGAVERQWLHNIPASIVAGTLEVQKNIIARQGLWLPGEARTGPSRSR